MLLRDFAGPSLSRLGRGSISLVLATLFEKSRNSPFIPTTLGRVDSAGMKVIRHKIREDRFAAFADWVSERDCSAQRINRRASSKQSDEACLRQLHWITKTDQIQRLQWSSLFVNQTHGRQVEGQCVLSRMIVGMAKKGK